MRPDYFEIWYLFAVTMGALFVPVIFGLVAVFMERPR